MPSDYAILARAPLQVVIAGERIPIPYRPAGAWALAMDHPGWIAALLPDEDGRERIADLVLTDARASTVWILRGSRKGRRLRSGRRSKPRF